jgi:hypothetical protein
VRVEARRCLVQHHHAGVLQEDPGQRHQLGLSGGQPADARTDHRVQPVGQLVEPGAESERLEDLHEPCIPDGRVIERDVVA